MNIQPPLLVEQLQEEGFIQKGTGCKIESMQVHIADRTRPVVNIQMGDNCCIMGTIIIYRAAAKVTIGNNVYIGPGTLLECTASIEIGNDVLVSGNCNIIDTNSHSLHSAERVHDTLDWQKGLMYKNWDVVDSAGVCIRSNCWVGLRAIVLKGVTLEQGTIVGAGSVVTRNSEKFSLIAGNPAKFIKHVD